MSKIGRVLLFAFGITLKAIKLFALLVVPLLALGFVLLSLRKDEPPPDDADLRLAFQETPAEENAFTYFTKASDELYDLQAEEHVRLRKILDSEIWDEAFVEVLLENNGKSLEFLQQGLRCAEFQVPDMATPGSHLSYLAGWRRIAELSSGRALYLLKTGEETGAFEECMRTVRFGQRIEDCRGSTIFNLVGRSVKEIALRRLRQVLARSDLPPDELKAYIAGLDEYRANEDALADTIRAEYMLQAKIVDDTAAGKDPFEPTQDDQEPRRRRRMPLMLLKPNKTKRLIATMCRTAIGNCPKHYVEMQLLEAKDAAQVHWIRLALRGNPIGEGLVDMLPHTLNALLAHKCCDNCSIAAAQILIALKCYQLGHGELPETLDELVPAYFEQLPRDDFDGKPIKYSKAKKAVYAVGTDLTDNGGIAEEDREGINPGDGYDLIYKIEF